MSDNTSKLASALAGLEDYGNNSIDGLKRGASAFHDMVMALMAATPEPIDRAAGVAAQYMPGYSLRKGYLESGEAARLRDQGRYTDSLLKSADAMDHGADFLWWLMPGGGLVPK